MRRWKFDSGDLYLGDLLEVLPTLPEDSVDLIICSPPYSDARTYLEDGQDLGIARDAEEWVSWMVEVVRACLRVCKGLCAFVVGHGAQKKYRWDAAPALLLADLHRAGVCLRNPKWYHRRGIPGSGCADDLAKTVEFIVCATKRQGELPWHDVKAVSKPWKYKPGGENSHRTKSGKRINFARGVSKTTGDVAYEKRLPKTEHANPGDLISVVVGGGHLGSSISHENEAPFPEELSDFFVKAWCPPGGVTLDPFAGSGTSLASAIKHGRRFVGVDLRPSQIELCKRRIRQATLEKGLL